MIRISKNRCVGCGLCVEICPVKAVSIENGIAVIDKNKCINCGSCTSNCPQGAVRDIKEELVVAIGADDEKIIKQDDHVGESKYYLIYRYSEGDLIFKEKRENVRYKEDETRIHGDPGKAKAVSSVLKGVDVIVGKIIGPNIVRMKKTFVPVIIREPEIKKSLEIIKENINEIVEEYEKSGEERRGIILI